MARKSDGSMLRKRVGNAIYPWHEWTDGDAWELIRGEDYQVPDSTMRNIAHGYASRKGMRVQTSITNEGVVVRFIKPSPPKKLKKVRPKK